MSDEAYNLPKQNRDPRLGSGAVNDEVKAGVAFMQSIVFSLRAILEGQAVTIRAFPDI
jgi:hypothetical protein